MVSSRLFQNNYITSLKSKKLSFKCLKHFQFRIFFSAPKVTGDESCDAHKSWMHIFYLPSFIIIKFEFTYRYSLIFKRLWNIGKPIYRVSLLSSNIVEIAGLLPLFQFDCYFTVLQIFADFVLLY